jgi:signal transduction histidine kinase
MNIFESAVKKLTIWYVGALFVVCLAFSVPVYVVSASRLTHSAIKQTEIIRGLNRGIYVPTIVSMRDQQIARDRQQLQRTIILANLAILSLGAYFSYLFAKRTLKPIEEAHEAQSRFTADASHELRTPLATMQAEIEVALREKKFSVAQAKSVLGSNLEEIARLRKLSDQLLNLTRLDGSKPLQKTPIKLDKVLKEEIDAAEKRHNITIQNSIQHGVSVQGDISLLKELAKIHTDNAVRYAGNQPAQIEISLEKQNNVAVMTISDHGIGIKASEIPHIFDRFYRGSNATQHATNGHGRSRQHTWQNYDIYYPATRIEMVT